LFCHCLFTSSLNISTWEFRLCVEILLVLSLSQVNLQYSWIEVTSPCQVNLQYSWIEVTSPCPVTLAMLCLSLLILNNEKAA
jgi:hypothetical protein